MGVEARCICRWQEGAGEVKALLETHELILRGGLKRRFPFAAMAGVRVEGEDLRFTSAGDDVALALGADRAGRWAKKIVTPPPSLAEKLGIGPSSKALVIGQADSDALQRAVAAGTAASSDEARLSLAVVADAVALEQALRVHETLPRGTPIWIVHGKGPRAPFGEGPVRNFMRNAGYRDTKVSAVSDDLSATRYSRS
ncbi:MAG TPA: hypothetical protein VN805_10665 [Caulobacteraceae bacterium]|nr:hypothetical protein [Caulobacteraceae bacterium]